MDFVFRLPMPVHGRQGAGFPEIKPQRYFYDQILLIERNIPWEINQCAKV